ncbi:MAG: HipA domain-containing protein [Halioglobus sp.]
MAWNPKTNEVRSGQVKAGAGFEYWLLKFDGVTGNQDKELEDPAGYGLIEYAYYLMALECGIDISECRLFREDGRSHFMTRRFATGLPPVRNFTCSHFAPWRTTISIWRALTATSRPCW